MLQGGSDGPPPSQDGQMQKCTFRQCGQFWVCCSQRFSSTRFGSTCVREACCQTLHLLTSGLLSPNCFACHKATSRQEAEDCESW